MTKKKVINFFGREKTAGPPNEISGYANDSISANEFACSKFDYPCSCCAPKVRMLDHTSNILVVKSKFLCLQNA